MNFICFELTAVFKIPLNVIIRMNIPAIKEFIIMVRTEKSILLHNITVKIISAKAEYPESIMRLHP